MQFSNAQLEKMADDIFIARLNESFVRTLPDFAALSSAARNEFLELSIAAADARGLETEQGLAAYALVAWFLGLGFESFSQNLPLLFASGFPEVRKVHAMNEWAHELLVSRRDVAAADQVLRQAFQRTSPWGAQRVL